MAKRTRKKRTNGPKAAAAPARKRGRPKKLKANRLLEYVFCLSGVNIAHVRELRSGGLVTDQEVAEFAVMLGWSPKEFKL